MLPPIVCYSRKETPDDGRFHKQKRKELNAKSFPQVRAHGGAGGWFIMGHPARSPSDHYLGRNRPHVSLLRHLAVSHKYRHDDYHLSYGLLDSEYAEPRRDRHPSEA